jgi:hypothetical protein
MPKYYVLQIFSQKCHEGLTSFPYFIYLCYGFPQKCENANFVYLNPRLNMEVDLQSLFGLTVT